MSNQTITEKIAELHELTDWFYGDDFSLEHATEKYEEATKLTKAIEKDLKELKNKIEVIDENFAES